ncbi:RING-H2 finger protein ATL39-like [Carex rostrata]
MPILFWMSVLAPIGIPVCFLVLKFIIDILYGLDRHPNGNQATATVATVTGPTLQAELREPPNTDGAHSFQIASLPTYLYNNEAVEGGLVCPICKDPFEKRDIVLQLPLCIHSYHKECIEAWLQRNLTCPVCRCRVDMEVPRDIALTID